MAIHNLLNASRKGRKETPPAPHAHVARWPATLALLALGALYVALDPVVRLGPSWLLFAVESPVIVFLLLAHRLELPVHPHVLRMAVLVLLGVATALVAVSLGLLLRNLVTVDNVTARQLLFSAAGLWAANVIIFGLWYWELDRGGPHRRHMPDPPAPDFLFPQQSGPGVGSPNWHPDFVDYLFVAFTNATAFSPTDTLPLTRRVKVLMMIEAICSLVMIAVLAARAINILH